MSNRVFWFDINIVQNVQNINADVTDSVGDAVCVCVSCSVVGPEALHDVKQRGH